MTTDPGLTPALEWWAHGPTRASVENGRGPERVTNEHSPKVKLRPVGFNARLEDEEPEDEEPEDEEPEAEEPEAEAEDAGIAGATVEEHGDQA